MKSVFTFFLIKKKEYSVQAFFWLGNSAKLWVGKYVLQGNPKYFKVTQKLLRGNSNILQAKAKVF